MTFARRRFLVSNKFVSNENLMTFFYSEPKEKGNEKGKLEIKNPE